MAGVYIHFPFCKQACDYCNFYFSTQMKNKENILVSIKKEIELRDFDLGEGPLESIYFGGGSPSLLNANEIESLILKIKQKFYFSSKTEITLEINPDDVTKEYLEAVKGIGVNRLSIGIQSFLDKDLLIMNRIHNSKQSIDSLEIVSKVFDNYSLDLIYGIPGSTIEEWDLNIVKALEFKPKHFSCYALTIEPKTVLSTKVKNKKIVLLDDDVIKKQFDHVISVLEQNNYLHYEVSNFAKPNYMSTNNRNYWLGKPYLGIGPSAHSFDGKLKRSWNISNNNLYIKSIKEGILPFEDEKLSIRESYNEYVMLGLRTFSGISIRKIENDFGRNYILHFQKESKKYLKSKLLVQDEDLIKIGSKGKFLSDRIASDLFKLKD